MPEFPLSWIIAGLAALIGVAMGSASLIVPRWGASIVRLAPDPRWPGGWSEFRASYGGALAFAHLAVLMTLAMSGRAGEGSVIGTSFALSLYWLGMALGRALSMTLDAERGTRTAYNGWAIVFEAAMGLALAAPFIAHLGR